MPKYKRVAAVAEGSACCTGCAYDIGEPICLADNDDSVMCVEDGKHYIFVEEPEVGKYSVAPYRELDGFGHETGTPLFSVNTEDGCMADSLREQDAKLICAALNQYKEE
ncbi:MAG: hypothetical protein KAS32_29610 [Candidatus Peribacteraceae bacterium]|nr:hypothetical protein [Candidatus Peribacteraceae bacterium]